MALIRPMRKYLKEVNLEISKYSKAFSVAKTMYLSDIGFDLSPFYQIYVGFTARYMPRDGRCREVIAKGWNLMVKLGARGGWPFS